MEQEEKELLLKDVCARLPYGLFVHDETSWEEDKKVIYTSYYHPNLGEVKPYLRPISSMTNNEIIQYFKARYPDVVSVEPDEHPIKGHIQAVVRTKNGVLASTVPYDDMVTTNTFDLLNELYLDWRGLIQKGLAIEWHPEESEKPV